MAEPLLTAEQFAAMKFDLPDGGRWTELVRGRIVHLQPPDEGHGNVVYNLSRALSVYFGPHQPTPGYACFELGLRVARDPDTVRCPAACCFIGAERFAEADKIVTDVRPSLVAEIASTNDRRRSLPERVTEYRAWGVELLWIIDPIGRQVQVEPHGQEAVTLTADQFLSGGSVLPGFSLTVARLFAAPDWWTTPRGRTR